MLQHVRPVVLVLLVLSAILFASFSSAAAAPVQLRIGSLTLPFDSIGTAVESVHSGETATINIQGGDIFEDPHVGVEGASIYMVGGYDSTFSGQNPMKLNTVLVGTLTISSGVVIATFDPSFIAPYSTGSLVVVGNVTVASGGLISDGLIIE